MLFQAIDEAEGARMTPFIKVITYDKPLQGLDFWPTVERNLRRIDGVISGKGYAPITIILDDLTEAGLFPETDNATNQLTIVQMMLYSITAGRYILPAFPVGKALPHPRSAFSSESLDAVFFFSRTY